jgi:hypothetical protein
MSSQLYHRLQATLVACSLSWGCGNAWCGEMSSITRTTIEGVSPPGSSNHSISFDYANLDVIIAGVAGGEEVVFVGEPLNGSIIALSRFTGRQIGELPHPPNGFVLPFIIHSLGKDKVAVLDAGGLPQPGCESPSNTARGAARFAASSSLNRAKSLPRSIGVPVVSPTQIWTCSSRNTASISSSSWGS